ncbi:MAG: MFS transporter [Firmicutes bacterium]|nr:MFS transporter [Bacillota bacterium]
MKPKMRLPFALLCGVPFVMVLSNSMLIPVLPLMQSQMKLSPFQIGLIVTAFSIPAGLTIPIAGYLSDRFGRKIVIVPALFIFGLGGLLAGVAALLTSRPFPWILAARVLQGLGGGGTYQMAMALTGDIFQSSERAKALGLLESANGLGKVVSPIIGSLAGLIIWFAPFYIYPLLAIPIAVGVWVKVQEPERERQHNSIRSYLSSIGKILRRDALSLAAALLTGLLVLFMLFGLLSYLSDVLEDEYNIDGLKKGFVIAIPVLGMALTSYLSGTWLQEQTGKTCKWVSIGGMLLVAISLLAPALTNNLYILLTAATLQGIGTGGVLPAINLLITGAADQRERGMITAFYGTARFFGAALGPPTFGLLVEKNKNLLFIFSAITVALIGGVAYACIKPPTMPGQNKQNEKNK